MLSHVGPLVFAVSAIPCLLTCFPHISLALYGHLNAFLLKNLVGRFVLEELCVFTTLTRSFHGPSLAMNEENNTSIAGTSICLTGSNCCRWTREKFIHPRTIPVAQCWEYQYRAGGGNDYFIALLNFCLEGENGQFSIYSHLFCTAICTFMVSNIQKVINPRESNKK